MRKPVPNLDLTRLRNRDGSMFLPERRARTVELAVLAALLGFWLAFAVLAVFADTPMQDEAAAERLAP